MTTNNRFIWSFHFFQLTWKNRWTCFTEFSCFIRLY